MTGGQREAEIAARAKAATPGNWLAKEGQVPGFVVVAENPQVAAVLVAVISSSGKRGRADAEFMANAKRDIPYLLAQLEAVAVWADDFPDVQVSELDRILKGGA